MSDLAFPVDSLAARFAQRVAERDNPPPPPPLSQEPAAVLARLMDWLRTTHRQRDPRGRRQLAHMLLALMEHPERTTAELGAAAGLKPRQAARLAVRLGTTLQLTTWDYRGLYRFHRLLPAAEDALLLVVTGPAGLAPAGAAQPDRAGGRP